MLEADGYRVDRHVAGISDESLSAADVLVISNALHETNVNNWELPTSSAFTAEEVQVIVSFVEAGGGLLLIADHMPFPGAAEDLAAEFDVTLRNGFAFSLDASEQTIHPDIFRRREFRASGRSQGRVNDHPILKRFIGDLVGMNLVRWAEGTNREPHIHVNEQIMLIQSGS